VKATSASSTSGIGTRRSQSNPAFTGRGIPSEAKGTRASALRLVVLLALTAAALLALTAAPASAVQLRTHQTSFATFTGQNPQALAVDQSNGDIYAISTETDTVSRFNSSGSPKNFTAGPNADTNTLTGLSFENYPSLAEIAIDNSGGPSNGNIYVTQSTTGQVKVFSSSGAPLGALTGSGTPAGGFGEDCGVAVDQSNGNVYIASYENRVWRYSPTGATVVEANYSGGIATSINPCQLAVASGSLYVHNWQETPNIGVGPLRKYATSAFALGAPPSPSSTLLDGKATAVATDPSNGNVYVDEGNKISVFDPSGASLYSFGSAADFGSASAGVAVRLGGGNAYVADPTNHQIDVYGPFSAPPPLVTTEPATGIGHTKATLHGHLDPNNSLPITSCQFEWGIDTGYTGGILPCAEGSSFTSPADVSAELTGLAPGTTYHFRLHVSTSSSGFSGEDRSFQAIPASSVPELSTGQASSLSSTSAELRGSINPNAHPLTGCHFEYVSDIAFYATGFTDLSSGGSLPCDQAPGSIPADFEDHPVSATVTGLDPATVYYFRLSAANANGAANGAGALVPGPPLVETTGSPVRTATTARLDSRVGPHGAATAYHFDYVSDSEFQASGFASAQSTPDASLVTDEVQELFLVGIEAGNFKLSFGGDTTPDLPFDASAAQVQAALRALPSIGSPNVTVTRSAELQEKKYFVTFTGSLGGTDVAQLTILNGTPPLNRTPVVRTLVSGGPGDRISFVSAAVQNLNPATTYHYRVVADNGNSDGPVFGDEMTLTTRASDVPLTHGRFPGPPGSDRAWEQVNTPDTGGNPVSRGAIAISDSGDRALYNVSGGNPGSETGTLFNQLFAERTPTGWQTRRIYPTRAEAPESAWTAPAGPSDLSQLVAVNYSTGGGLNADTWRISPGAQPQRLSDVPISTWLAFTAVSDDASRVITLLKGSFDPDHPVAPAPPLSSADQNLYDVSSGTPHLVSLLPDGSVPTCGAGRVGPQATFVSGLFTQRRAQHWVSADGSHVFFPSQGSGNCTFGPTQLYVRDLNADTTTLISSPPLSGPNCGAQFIKSTPGAVFFWTQNRLAADDAVHTGSCGFGEGKDGDVYRYDLGGGPGAIECVTCVVPGLAADVLTESDSDASGVITVSDDGSRVYFASPNRLVAGAATDPRGIYRVDVASGDVAYVAPNWFRGAGESSSKGNAVNPDGSVYVFRSDDPGLNALNGPRNGGTQQYYRYDDTDRSLVCVSCPSGGGLPRADVPPSLGSGGQQLGPNLNLLSAAGDVLGFSTPTPLVSADQNTAAPSHDQTAGIDAYEWRDGALHLISDGLTSAAGASTAPAINGVTPSGRDVFFVDAAQLTPDAIDAYQRLYDARIGGGFEFPNPPPPCPLEVCQGTPKGSPDDPSPSSATFSGAGNSTPHFKKHRKHHHRKHHKRAHHRAANHNRRAAR
jgi:hypothetical protein